MGVALSYVTAEPVPLGTRRAIVSEADRLEHHWWAEGMYFEQEPGDNARLLGRTKLFLLGYDAPGGEFRDIDLDEDTLMAWRDASFIVSQLEQWSRQHGIAWELQIEGQPIGRISGGALDERGKRYLAEMIDMIEIPVAEREVRMVQIGARYADRWDDDT